MNPPTPAANETPQAGLAPPTVESLVEELECERTRRVAAEQELSQVLYVVSHDLPEPARMVRGFLQLLNRRLGESLDAECQEFIGFATDGAERLQAMLAALLTLSRVQTRQKAKKPVELRKVVDAAVAQCTAVITASAAQVTVAVDDTVVADRNQLQQALVGLIQNAIAYHGEEVPRVDISSVRRGREVTVRVVDNGRGIAPADRARAIQVFGRLQGRVGEGGLGLGLAYAARVLRSHSGALELSDGPNGGTCVALKFCDSEVEDGPF